MADNDIKIQITTTAETSGADNTAESIRRIDTAVDKASDSMRQMGRLKEMENMTDKAKVAEWGFHDLDAEITKTTKATETFTAGATSMAPAAKNSGRALLMFSQGFEDAQYGIKGVLNNIPGLVMALGGTAGLAGAISIAAVGFSVLSSWFAATGDSAETLKKKAEELTEIVDNVAKAAGEGERDRFDEVGEKIANEKAAMQALKEKFDETKKAEGEYAVSVIGNAEKVRTAQVKVAEALGLQTNEMRQMQAIEAEKDAKQALAARQALEQEDKRLTKAHEISNEKSSDLLNLKLRYDGEQKNLDKLREQLGVLREQKSELEKIAEAPNPYSNPFSDRIGFKEEAFIKDQKKAQKNLDDPYFKANLAATEARVNEMENAVRELAKLIPKSEHAFNSAVKTAEDIERAVTTKLQQVKETLKADNQLQKADEIEKVGKQFAKDVEKFAGNITANNAEGKAAVESLKTATKDGKIDSTELEKVDASVRTLIGQVQSHTATSKQNNAEFIKEFTTVQNDAAEFKKLAAEALQKLSASTSEANNTILQSFQKRDVENQALKRKLDEMNSKINQLFSIGR